MYPDLLRPVLLACLMLGCSETGLDGIIDPEPPPEEEPPGPSALPWSHEDPTVDTDRPPRPECPELDMSEAGVDVNDACGTLGEPGSFEITEERIIGSEITLAQPVVGMLNDDDGDGDIDSDDITDLVIVTRENDVVAYSADTGSEHWRFDGSGGYWNVQPALADVDGDGVNDVVAVVGMRHGGPWDQSLVALKGDTGEVLWSTIVEEIGFRHGHNSISIGDMNGDGDLEIGYGNAAFNGQTGEMLFQSWDGGTGSPACAPGLQQPDATMSVMADLDQDGRDELLMGNAAYDHKGTTLWTTGTTDGAPVVANFDDDPEAEFLTTYNHGFCSPNTADVRLFDHDGTLLWKVSYGGSSPLTSTSLATVADFDGDGEPEVAFSLQDVTLSVGYPAAYVMLDTDGTPMWVANALAPYDRLGAGGLSAVDIDQDGAYELVVADRERVKILSGTDGSTLASYDMPAAGGYHAPMVADIDKDGQAEILVPRQDLFDPSVGGIAVLGGAKADWPATQTTWAEHGHRSWRRHVDLSLAGPADWSQHNGYRAAWHPLFEASDATLEVVDLCEVECDQDRLLLSWRVGNAGPVELPAGTEVVAWTGDDSRPTELFRQVVSTAVPSGQTTAGHLLELDPADVVDGRVVLEIVNTTQTCDPDGDMVVLEGLCTD